MKKNILIIPAAGKGTRLGSGLPKALTYVRGLPMLIQIIQKLSSQFDQVIIVTSNHEEVEFKREIEKFLRKKVKDKIIIKHQQSPSGSLDAVISGMKGIEFDAAVIVWADQIGVSKRTVNKVLRKTYSTQKSIVIPIIFDSFPYVWFRFKIFKMTLKRVGRSRDGDKSPLFGLADIGVFGLNSFAYNNLCAVSNNIINTDENREKDFIYALGKKEFIHSLYFFLVYRRSQLISINTKQQLNEAERRKRWKELYFVGAVAHKRCKKPSQ
jgi:CTP:molybdopterin cytidylyltransferase MocA